MTLALAAVVGLAVGDPTELALALVLVPMLVVVTLTDLERRIIPNRVLAAAALVGLAIVAVGEPSTLLERAVAAVAAGGLLHSANLLDRGAFGFGDVKLAAVMGLFLGTEVAPAMIAALLAGSALAVVISLRSGSLARKQTIPFGPCLALGGVVALLAGRLMIGAYLGAFGP
jgi:prepilin signal peptidase PulO-like enzyme (type II secretory pathway)